QAMFLTKLKSIAVALVTVALVAAGAGFVSVPGAADSAPVAVAAQPTDPLPAAQAQSQDDLDPAKLKREIERLRAELERTRRDLARAEQRLEAYLAGEAKAKNKDDKAKSNEALIKAIGEALKRIGDKNRDDPAVRDAAIKAIQELQRRIGDKADPMP